MGNTDPGDCRHKASDQLGLGYQTDPTATRAGDPWDTEGVDPSMTTKITYPED